MMSTRVRVSAERMIAARRLRRSGAVARVPKDSNNIFSLHDTAVEPGIKAVSFDFFDTLVMRQHLTLDQVFRKTAALAADLLPGDRARLYRKIYGARGFTAAALKREMTHTKAGDEPSLEAVFDRALTTLLPDPEARATAVRRLVDAEAGIEARNLAPNPEALPLFRALKASGLKVLITSDMYLPRRAMEQIVQAMGFAPHVDHLFVSADHGVTKASGALFDIVAQQTGLAPDEILHVGDNWQSDVVMARRQGFRALHYVNADWLHHDRTLAARAALPRSDALARDTMRRRFGMADPAPLASLDAIIDQVIGPAAERRGSSDIYFLTRDGTIFLEIAEAARTAHPGLIGSTARLRRLATSRATGHLFKLAKLDPNRLIAATNYLTEAAFSLHRFFQLFDLAPADFASSGPKLTALIARHLADPSEAPFRSAMKSAAFRRV